MSRADVLIHGFTINDMMAQRSALSQKVNWIIVYLYRPFKQHGQQHARWRHLQFSYHLNMSLLWAQSHSLGLTVNQIFYSR